MNEFQDDTGKSHGLITAAACLASVVSIAIAIWLFSGIDWTNPDKSSTAISATVTTLAFIWLVAGFFQQRLELKQNTAALLLQFNELRNQVEETKHLVEANRQSAEAAARQAMASEQLLIAERDKLNFQRSSRLQNSEPRFVFDSLVNQNQGWVVMKFVNLGGPARNIIGQPVNTEFEVTVQPSDFIDSNQPGTLMLDWPEKSVFVPTGTMFSIEGINSSDESFQKVYSYHGGGVGFSEYFG